LGDAVLWCEFAGIKEEGQDSLKEFRNGTGIKGARPFIELNGRAPTENKRRCLSVRHMIMNHRRATGRSADVINLSSWETGLAEHETQLSSRTIRPRGLPLACQRKNRRCLLDTSPEGRRATADKLKKERRRRRDFTV